MTRADRVCSAAVAAGVVGSEESLPRAAGRDRRGRALDLRREGVVHPPPRRGDRGARLRGGRRRGRGDAARHALPGGHGIAGWVLATRTPLVIEDVQAGPALRERRRRGHRLRPERADGRAAPARRAGARRARGARPPRALALQPPGDGAPRALREPGGDRRRPAPQRARRAERCSSGDEEGRSGGRRAACGRRRRARGRTARGRAAAPRDLADTLGPEKARVARRACPGLETAQLSLLERPASSTWSPRTRGLSDEP